MTEQGTIVCNRCGEAKPADSMITRSGKPARLCKGCFGKSFIKHGSRAKHQPKIGKKRGRPAASEEPSAPANAPPELNLPPTYSLRAALEGEFLVLTQEDSAGNENSVYLATTQVHQLLQTFGDWLGRGA